MSALGALGSGGASVHSSTAAIGGTTPSSLASSSSSLSGPWSSSFGSKGPSGPGSAPSSEAHENNKAARRQSAAAAGQLALLASLYSRRSMPPLSLNGAPEGKAAPPAVKSSTTRQGLPLGGSARHLAGVSAAPVAATEWCDVVIRTSVVPWSQIAGEFIVLEEEDTHVQTMSATPRDWSRTPRAGDRDAISGSGFEGSATSDLKRRNNSVDNQMHPLGADTGEKDKARKRLKSGSPRGTAGGAGGGAGGASVAADEWTGAPATAAAAPGVVLAPSFREIVPITVRCAAVMSLHD